MTNNLVSPIILFCNPRHQYSLTARSLSFLQTSSFNSQLLTISLPAQCLPGTQPNVSAPQQSTQVPTPTTLSSKHLTTLRSLVEFQQPALGLKRMLCRCFQRRQWWQDSTQKRVPNGFKAWCHPTRASSLITGNLRIKDTDILLHTIRPRCLSTTQPLRLKVPVEPLSALWARQLSHLLCRVSHRIKSELQCECRPRPLKSQDLKNQIPLD